MDTEIIATSSDQSFEIELDWETYFNEFCNKHGKYPVVYGKDKQLLLFPDGWTYSIDSYDGPEFPPPSDPYQLALIQHYYWNRRQRIVKLDLISITSDWNYLKDIQRSKSQSLYQTIQYTNEEGKIIQENKALDLTQMQKRKEWLENDLKNCKTMVEKYQKTITELEKKHA